MSFTGDVKEELSRQLSSARHCQIAEIAAITSICGRILISANDRYCIKIQSENIAVVRKYFTLLKKTFNLNDDSKINYIKHGSNLYPIIDDKQTVVYDHQILNLIEEIKELEQIGINYFVINSFEIENIQEVLENFKNNKVFKVQNEGKGFLYEETIYKVIK